MNRFNTHFCRTETGTGMLEFALVLPMLLLFIYGSFEVARSVMDYEFVASVSREAANAAYRDCPATGSGVITCLQEVATRIEDSIKSATGNNEVVVALQVFDTSTVDPSKADLSTATRQSSVTDNQILLDQQIKNLQFSAEDLERLDTTDSIASVLKRGLRAIFVGEVFYVHRPSTSIIPGFSAKVFHEATIY